MRRSWLLVGLAVAGLALASGYQAPARADDGLVHYRGLLTQTNNTDYNDQWGEYDHLSGSAIADFGFDGYILASATGKDMSFAGDSYRANGDCPYTDTISLGSEPPLYAMFDWGSPNEKIGYSRHLVRSGPCGDYTFPDYPALPIFKCPLTSGYVGADKLVFDYHYHTVYDNGTVFDESCTGTLTKDGEDPVAAIAYHGSGTNQFFFDGSGSVATAPGATLTKYDWDFGDGTGSGSVVTHTFTSPGQHTVKLTVTDSNGKTGSTTVTLVPKLTITDVSVDPDPASPGDPATLHVTVRNDGGVQLLSVQPTATVAPDTVATIDYGPTPAQADLAAGTTQTFDYTLNAVDNGKATATVDASGTGPGGAVDATQVTHDFAVAATSLALDVKLDPDTVGVGGTTKAKLTVTNNSGHAVRDLKTTLTADPSADATIGDPTGGDSILANGDSTTFTIPVTAKKEGKLTLTGKATAVIELNGNSVASPEKQTELQVDNEDIVTTAGDETLPDWAKDARICDVKADEDGNQCTLRAAIDLANAWKERDSLLISFDIPGGGVPRIAPTTDLPGLEHDHVSIDGTTQSGGWVELSGSAQTGDGLTLAGTNILVRGLVINGFQAGILIARANKAGDTSDVIAGNRIGTDPTGLRAVPNKWGIDVIGGRGTIIGGTAGTSPTACTGDCNLLAGNTTTQVWVQYRSDGIKVQGNWVGVDATGTAPLPGSRGISFENFDQSTVSQSLIGGPTTRPGLAPGNIIAASDTGVFCYPNYHDVATLLRVQGNLVGLQPDGTHAIGEGRVGIQGLEGLGACGGTVGGDSPEMRNVIGGMEGAGIIGSWAVKGNFIGTDITGTKAVRNGVGVDVNDLNPLTDNVIAGNGVGVGAGKLAHGNLVGLTADGTAPLPNDVGVGVLPGASLAASITIGSGCTSQPCNVISGNRVAGIYLRGTPAFEVYGAYIGTDVTGTKAIPNGVGVDIGGPTSATHIGSASPVFASGNCTYPCNIIAGNSGVGVHIVRDGTYVTPPANDFWIAGNLIGVGADGHPLPNGGPAVDVSGPASVPTLKIGGSYGDPNVIVSSGFPDVVVEANGPAKPPVTIQTNRFKMLGGQIPPIVIGTLNPTPPKIEKVTKSNGTLHVEGHVLPGAGDPTKPPEEVELYAVRTCTNGSGAKPINPLDGEPLQLVPANVVTGSFSADIPVSALGSRGYLSGLRTNQAGSTSRFAFCTTVP